MTQGLLWVVLLIAVSVQASAQDADPVSLPELLLDAHGTSVEWTVETVAGVETITLWHIAPTDADPPPAAITQPNAATIAAWRADPVRLARIRAARTLTATDLRLQTFFATHLIRRGHALRRRRPLATLDCRERQPCP